MNRLSIHVFKCQHQRAWAVRRPYSSNALPSPVFSNLRKSDCGRKGFRASAAKNARKLCDKTGHCRTAYTPALGDGDSRIVPESPTAKTRGSESDCKVSRVA